VPTQQTTPQAKTTPPPTAGGPFHSIASLAVSRDGRRVAGFGGMTSGASRWSPAVKAWDAAAYPASIRDLRGATGFPDGRVALSPDGTVVAANCYQELMFWKADTGAVLSTAKLPTGAKGGSMAERLAFTADGSAAVVISDDKIVTGRAASGAVTVVAPADKPGRRAVYVPGLNRVMEARRAKDFVSAELASWDPTADRPPTTVVLESVKDNPGTFDVSADGKVVAVGSGPFANPPRVTFHDATTGRKTAEVLRDDNPLFKSYSELTLSPDGKYVAGAGGGEFAAKFYTLDLFQTADGRRVHRSTGLPGPTGPRFAGGLAFSGDGKTLFFVRSGSTVVQLDTATGAEVR
jgi:hypothetical protein